MNKRKGAVKGAASEQRKAIFTDWGKSAVMRIQIRMETSETLRRAIMRTTTLGS